MTPDNWISILSLFVDIVKTLIPFVTIFFIFRMFRRQIRYLIKNGGFKFSGAGISVETSNNQQKDISDKEKKTIEDINNELNTVKEREEKLKQLQEYTVRDKDTFYLGFHFEKTYRLIFPSQMLILKLLNESSGEIMSALTHSIYIRTIWAQKFNTTFEQFIGFLIQSGLVIYEQATNKFLITNMGKLFWEYIKNNNIPLKIPVNDLA